MQNRKQEDMPVGFSMKLAQNLNALSNYSNLSDLKKEELNNYIKNSCTGIQAKNKIENIILKLEQNDITNLF